jgi:TetR/AcrR family transcriptional repressor of nem operon
MTSNTADQILDCAHALIMEVGYSGFSYADIAQRIGIAKPSIHHHFPTKAQLVLKVVQRYREQIRVALEHGARTVTDPALQLAGYAGYWEACIADGSASFCVCAMLASERRTLPDEVKAEVAGHFKTLTGWLGDVLGRGAASGQFTLQQPVAVEAQCFMALIHGAMLSARALDDSAAFQVVAQAGVARLTSRPAN